MWLLGSNLRESCRCPAPDGPACSGRRDVPGCRRLCGQPLRPRRRRRNHSVGQQQMKELIGWSAEALVGRNMLDFSRSRHRSDDPAAGAAIETIVTALQARGAGLSDPARAKPPRPYPPDHPHAELLRRDGFHLTISHAHPAASTPPASQPGSRHDWRSTGGSSTGSPTADRGLPEPARCRRRGCRAARGVDRGAPGRQAAVAVRQGLSGRAPRALGSAGSG